MNATDTEEDYILDDEDVSGAEYFSNVLVDDDEDEDIEDEDELIDDVADDVEEAIHAEDDEEDYIESMLYRINDEIIKESGINEEDAELIDEAFFNKYKEKPFSGKFAHTKLIIRKRGMENVDPNKVVRYMKSNIMPQLDRIVESIAESKMPLLAKRSPESRKKWIDRIYKHVRTIVLSKELVGGKYKISTTYATDGSTTTTFIGDISENGDMNFKYQSTITTHVAVY